MATDFDLPPLFDVAIKKTNGQLVLSDIYVNWLSNFVQTLIGYITTNGFFPPNLDNSQMRDIDDPQNGQLIYNTDQDALMFYQASSNDWKLISYEG